MVRPSQGGEGSGDKIFTSRLFSSAAGGGKAGQRGRGRFGNVPGNTPWPVALVGDKIGTIRDPKVSCEKRGSVR